MVHADDEEAERVVREVLDDEGEVVSGSEARAHRRDRSCDAGRVGVGEAVVVAHAASRDHLEVVVDDEGIGDADRAEHVGEAEAHLTVEAVSEVALERESAIEVERDLADRVVDFDVDRRPDVARGTGDGRRRSREQCLEEAAGVVAAVAEVAGVRVRKRRAVRLTHRRVGAVAEPAVVRARAAVAVESEVGAGARDRAEELVERRPVTGDADVGVLSSASCAAEVHPDVDRQGVVISVDGGVVEARDGVRLTDRGVRREAESTRVARARTRCQRDACGDVVEAELLDTVDGTVVRDRVDGGRVGLEVVGDQGDLGGSRGGE